MQRIKSVIAKLNKNPIKWTLIGLVVVVGVCLRFLAMARGHNFDFESYKIVGDIIVNGGNVYAETARYNYGPVWFTILGGFREVATLFANQDVVFRILIVSLLTGVDLAIAFLLKRKFGLLAFILFFLNPISIIISGYHNQFDNLAILIGLLGLVMYEKANTKRLDRYHGYAALLIGLSLMTKHIFFFLPVWLFIRAKTLRTKLFILLCPVILFAAAFLPFWMKGYSGIVQNVFLYKSFANAPLLHSLTSTSVQAFITPAALLLAVLFIGGFLTKKLPPLTAGLWYLIAIVSFSPAIANQYLAIVMPAVIALSPVFFLPFIIFAAIFLAIISPEGVHLTCFIDEIPSGLLPYLSPDGSRGEYNLIVLSLFFGGVVGWIYRYKRNWFIAVYRICAAEARRQYRQLHM